MKVSILIPCKNAERWIRKAVTSALSQTHTNCEVLVWDDGSSDSSARILASFGTQIRVIGNTPIGSNPARNRLLDAASGQWIQFLDADDYLEPRKIAAQLTEIHSKGADVVYGPVKEEIWRGNEVKTCHVIAPQDPQDLIGTWLRWHLAQTGSVLWKRSAIQRLGGWHPKQPCCQDNEIMLRALQRGLSFTYCPFPGAIYRLWSEDTLCRRNPTMVIRERSRLTDVMLEWLESTGRLYDPYRRLAAQGAFEMARTLAKYDLDEADAFHRERHARYGLMLRGDAAPFSYRAVYRLAGFRCAERLALALRP